MPDAVVYVDTSEVREGRLEELESAIRDLAELVEANEPRVLAYSVYFNHDRTRMTVMQVHPDAASLDRHLEVATPLFPAFESLLELRTVDVYGEPSDAAVERLRKKAEMLGGARLTVHRHHAGFARLGSERAHSDPGLPA